MHTKTPLKTHLAHGLFAAAVIGIPLGAAAEPSAVATAAQAAEQQEADYRVIAARCGAPAFEHAFYKQSRAAVAAGVVVKNRDPVEVEKAITAMRRSPVVLVASNSECPDQLKQLAEVQKQRSGSIHGSRKTAAAH